jgi:transcriptional regulator with XRE-family HTH domain
MAAGLRQIDLAQICHVGAQFICEIERGQSNPSLETMALIATGLNCAVADLLLAEGDVLTSADDMRRAQEALAVLGSILKPRKRV